MLRKPAGRSGNAVGSELPPAFRTLFNARLQHRTSSPALAWLTALSLDAPLVAVVWQETIARTAGIALSPTARLVLALGVWLGYMADRWLDARQMDASNISTLRHRFAKTQARPVAVAWMLVAIGTTMLAVAGLARRELVFGTIVGLATLAYLGAAHWRPARPWLGRGKELAIATLFTAGCASFPLAHTTFGAIWVPTLTLAGLCWLNCVTVSLWDRPIDARQSQPSMAITWQLSPQRLQVAAIGLGMLLAAAGVVLWKHAHGVVAIAGAVAALGMFGLLRADARIPAEARRALVDATLLSPLLVWPWL